MSAGSPRRSRSKIRTPHGTTTTTTISPQQVTDPTILDSVAGFINEVATYNLPCDTKDQIQWAKFQQLDREIISENVEGDKIIPSALILILGYSTGVQVWAIPASGEAVELLSWRHGSVKVLQFLPTPLIGKNTSQEDMYTLKRPLMALCDTSTPGPQHCALNFLSLKTGEQVKVIKFKNPILDVLANRNSVVVTFSERIAVFDALTLEDRLTVTTCYLSPGLYPNPITLGTRWMAYAERKLISSKRSCGGNEGEGVQSYTATVLHAAKSLGKGLRELGETVASSLTGNPTFKVGSSPSNTLIIGSNGTDIVQKGVVTILDIENQLTDDKTLLTDGVIAHFAAHTEAIVCLAFDPSGLLLLTADKRGHDFHLFRVHPHPGGPGLAAIHHLYILHRGDTTARVQDMCFSPDSRWVGVSTLRGTTHVFPVTPYGGNVGVRTHATPHVVNRMSRFHRSAGLPVEGRSNSPISLFEAPVNSNIPYNNPRLPPYPHPTVVHPLAQIRQPLFIPPGGNLPQRSHTGRPRLNSSSEDNIQIAIRLCCCFAPARAWFDNTGNSHESTTTKKQIKPVESLFIMTCHGTLLQYDLDPHPVASVPKEKVCDETPIELTVQAKAQWILQRQLHLNDIPLPISPENLNLLPQDIPLYKTTVANNSDDRWLSQVEIVTHAGPHRRLWMGPQFTFKTYTTNCSSLSLSEVQGIDVNRSKPVNMPVSTAYPILIESGSASSCEQSPKLLDTYQRVSEEVGGAGELQLKEDLADAMLESPGVRETGGRCVIVSMKPHTTSVAKVVNPLGTVVTIHSDEDTVIEDVEDAVIHENCDEALFRPVVTPKSHLFTESKMLNANKSISNKCTLENVKDNDKQTKKINTSLSHMKTKIETDVNKMLLKNNRLEHKSTSQSDVKIEKNVDVTVTQKKTKPKSKQIVGDKNIDKEKILEPNTKQNLEPIVQNGDSQTMPVLKTLISTPDLVDNVSTFNFPIAIKPKHHDDLNEHEKFAFTPLFNKNDPVKEDRFEDARSENTELCPTFIMDSQKENKLPKTTKHNREIEEVTLSSEEEKNATKKIRKPKAKLGVRLSKSKEVEKEIETSVEITLPPPKKTWSSIVSSKPPTESELKLPPPILDLPNCGETDQAEQEDMPKKSYSTAAKQHLFEIDPNEDTCNSEVLLPERVYKQLEDTSVIDDCKHEVKSDDEKQDNCGSQNETTESDDSSKVIAMDTEEDSCQPETAKDTSTSDKSIKKKSKKKKR
ncbi:hypothetical protein RI129_007768 [Pyrocoelia pectoralis]|uniref:BCAS3 WD40 domain-containing protein n=1 Tax=Pyrocoelia pectoralis TaxID=417401 RepID=A0AAN7VER2_9COLE